MDINISEKQLEAIKSYLEDFFVLPSFKEIKKQIKEITYSQYLFTIVAQRIN